jgi:HD-GYP domain-containing protein (c-di-GMP phosphodiesterase class II)
MASRITFVCDAYHAMTSDRPYRAALSPVAARAEIAAGAGTQFCPESAAALLAILEGPG